MNKLVAVVAGEAFGAYVDLRPASATSGRSSRSRSPRACRCSCPAASATGSRPPRAGVTQYLYCFDHEWAPGMAGVACNPLDPALGHRLAAADRSRATAPRCRRRTSTPHRSPTSTEPTDEAARHRRGRLHRLQLRALRARGAPTTRWSSTTRSPTRGPLHPRTSTTTRATRSSRATSATPARSRTPIAGRRRRRHFAAESHVDRSHRRPGRLRDTNCFGTNIVMDTARRLEVGRVPSLGTDEVYGVGSRRARSSPRTIPSSPARPTPPRRPARDPDRAQLPPHPRPAGHVTRCTNNFGPYQYPEKAIPLFTTNLLDGGSRCRSTATASTSATGSTSTTTARGVAPRAPPRAASGEIYNIGAGNETPNRVLVDKLLALLGKDESLRRLRRGPPRPRPPLLGRHRQDHRARLGEAAHRFDEALEATVDWYRANDWWWRPAQSRAADRAGPRSPGPGASSVTTSSGPAREAGDEVIACDRARLDLTDRDAVYQAITGTQPDVGDQRGRLDGRRRLRGRPRPGLPHERARHRVGGRRVPAGRRPPGGRVHRLRVRRHQGRAVPRVGPPEPAVGLRALEAGRGARGRGARTGLDVVRTAWVCGAHGAQHGEDRAAGCSIARSWPSSTTSGAARASPPTWRRPSAASPSSAVPGILPRHQPGRHHLVRLRARHPRAGRPRPGQGAPDHHRRARSAPPGAPPGQLRARQRRPAARRACRCSRTTVSPSSASCGELGASR